MLSLATSRFNPHRIFFKIGKKLTALWTRRQDIYKSLFFDHTPARAKNASPQDRRPLLSDAGKNYLAVHQKTLKISVKTHEKAVCRQDRNIIYMEEFHNLLKVEKMIQSNLVDIIKIARIPPPIAEIIQQTLGLGSPHVPVGLLDAANEILVGAGIARIGTALPHLPKSDSAPLANCEVLSHVANGPPSLVTTSKHKDLTKLIRRICSVFASADIVVIVKNKNVGYKLVQALRDDEQSAWYMEKEYALKEDQPHPNHRIRIVKQDKLALWSLDLHRADIVVVTDAVEFVHHHYFCHPTEWFNTNKGTFIQPDARVVGVVSQDAHPRDMKLVYPIFGLRTFQLGAEGKAVLAPLVKWLSRTKQDNSDKRVGNDQSIRNQKEKTIWQNQQRNNFIVKKINEVRRELAGYAFVQERYGTDSGDALAVVVENTIHLTAFQAAMTVKGVSCPVLTFEEIQNASSLPAVLIRADAGTGLLPIRAQENPVLVLDIKDEAPGFLRRRTKLRNNAYQQHWHCGAMPFVEKLEWVNNKHR